MHDVVLSCTRARRQMLQTMPPAKHVVHGLLETESTAFTPDNHVPIRASGKTRDEKNFARSRRDEGDRHRETYALRIGCC
jgi:hypothetical protein